MTEGFCVIGIVVVDRFGMSAVSINGGVVVTGGVDGVVSSLSFARLHHSPGIWSFQHLSE